MTRDELRDLAKQVGSAKDLVAPKKRGEAGDLDGEKLLAWLAEDGARVRRPIIVVGKAVTLGYKEDAMKALVSKL